MNSGSVANLVQGAQRPRHLWVPEYVRSYGQEVIELAEMAGLEADEWQRFVIEILTAVRADGLWAAFEAGLEVPRQNGKGGIYELRELAGLFLFKERLLIHSAHEYKTAEQALNRMEALLDGCADLSREVKTIKRSHGQEGIYLKSGQELRYFTRTSSGGRGFSCDFLGLDEAMKIKHSMHAAMFPTMAARENPQILYAGSAVDQATMDDGIVFARVRERGIQGDDPRLAYFGWSAPFDHPDDVPTQAAQDPDVWAQANPALGIRVTPEYIEMEQRALSARGFAVERLGVGDWPSTEENGEQVISDDDWDALEDRASKRVGAVCFTFDVTPDRRHAAIAAGGHRGDGLEHVEIVDHREGTGWLVDRVVELNERHGPEVIACDGRGPAASFVEDLAKRGVQVEAIDAQDHAQACGSLIDAVADQSFRHLGTPEVRAAIKGAAKRTLVDAWAWSRKSSSADISPLVAFTLARRKAEIMRESAYEDSELLIA